MNVFNGSQFRSSAPTTYGFEPGHVFAICDFDEVLYEHVSHDRRVLTAKPVPNPKLPQVFTQDEFRALVEAGKVDPRLEQSSVSRHHVRPGRCGRGVGGAVLLLEALPPCRADER